MTEESYNLSTATLPAYQIRLGQNKIGCSSPHHHFHTDKIHSNNVHRSRWPSYTIPHTPTLYIQPYWQGWVHALRVVSWIQTTPASDELPHLLLEDNNKEGMGIGNREKNLGGGRDKSLFTMALLMFAILWTFVILFFLLLYLSLLVLTRIQIQHISLSPPSWLSTVQNTFPILEMVSANLKHNLQFRTFNNTDDIRKPCNKEPPWQREVDYA